MCQAGRKTLLTYLLHRSSTLETNLSDTLDGGIYDVK